MVGGFTDDDCTGRGVCHSGLRCSGGVYSWAASRVGGLQEAKHEVRGRAYSDAVRRGALGARNGMARLAQLATGSVGIMSSELWRFGIKPCGDGGCADWRRRRNAHYQTLDGGGGLLVKAVADERQMRAPAPSPAPNDARGGAV